MPIGNTCPCPRKCACHRLKRPGRCGIRQCCAYAGQVWLCGSFRPREQAEQTIAVYAKESAEMKAKVQAAVAATIK